MIEFSLLGIRVRVEPWFWLTCIFLGGGLDAQSKEAWLGVALFAMAAFISILIHEFGHALMIKKNKLPTEVVLTAMGGYATYPAGILTRKQSFFVTAAGPAVQLVFGLVIWFGVWRQFEMPSLYMGHFVYYLVSVSVVWAIFNCLPIFPLDGGQMLAAVLGPRRAKGLHVTGMITAGVVGLLALKGGLIFMAVFMAYFAYQNYTGYKQARY